MVAFKSFADELQEKWRKGSREYYGQVMEHLCRPMSSGIFGEHARRVVAREYALSALQEPNEISLELELKLVGHLYSGESEAYAPTDEQWIRERNREVGARVHAWKRLLDALDPNWDVNDAPPWRPSLPRGVRSVEGFAPEYIEDPELRAQYEAAVEEHRRRWKTYSMQNKIHKWARRFPQHQEDAIITAYSRPPHDMAEMERQLKKCVADEQTRAAILNAVTNNIEKEHKNNLQRKLAPDMQGRP